MALGTAALQDGIEALHNELYANADTLTPAQAGHRYAVRMAELFETFVKSGDGKYQAGLVAGATPVTAPGAPTVIKIV